MISARFFCCALACKAKIVHVIGTTSRITPSTMNIVIDMRLNSASGLRYGIKENLTYCLKMSLCWFGFHVKKSVGVKQAANILVSGTRFVQVSE